MDGMDLYTSEFLYTMERLEEQLHDKALLEPIPLTIEHLQEIYNELGRITLCWPEIKNPEFNGRTQFPESYHTNNNKERLSLLYAENFRRQYLHKFKTRKPILIACENECKIQKLVCSTIRPTTLPYKPLYFWENAARFVADHCVYEPLEKPTVLPSRLMSPQSVLELERGNSFEIATLLVSLLIGVGYDAYIVSGYATEDVSCNIMIRTICPDQLEDVEVESTTVEEDIKYKLRTPNDLNSHYLKRMELAEQEKRNRDFNRIEEKRLAEIAEAEKAPPDPLFGLRIHAWVVVLAGKRDVSESFFIEPSTGVKHDLNTDCYLGLETIWNDKNYWINMQDCSEGLENLRWDLTVVGDWEHFLMGEPFDARVIPKTLPDLPELDEYVRNPNLVEKHLDVPQSWSERIKLPFSMYERRYPNGQKVIKYKKCRLELFAPYVQTDGLLKRATTFFDMEQTEPKCVYEFYENREDCLVKYERNLITEQITAHFARGRPDACKEHRFYMNENTVEGRHVIAFFAICRADGLKYFEMAPTYLIEQFEKRDDFLNYRRVLFAERGKPPPGMKEDDRRIVINILEKFDRDYSKPAYKDVSSREFAILDNEIRLIYHYVKGRITASTRDFIKPPLTEMGDRLTFNPNKSSGYMSETGIKPPRQLQLLGVLAQVLEDEASSAYHVRIAEDELSAHIMRRNLEMNVPKLTVKLYHPERNYESRNGMLEREKMEREQIKREVDVEADYLAPFLVRIGCRDQQMTKEQAQQVYELCLEDFKKKLVAHATDIQKQFDREYSALEERQAWFESIQESMTRAEEEEYFASISGQTFMLHCLEMRLDRHKELSTTKYTQLLQCLRSDPRLRILFK